ncbi:hypothetical protein E2562_038244 [Oryza meyeriana var. granulata]|uniref:Uncharacterized protein n=1 Tax=Oryza meyeriana var. granulata TaxID=110450 RepID=A0A6G1E9C7_9ORYZ|nr:hypothetical protein E2562_038244 [Oryza meyeriana var. granulata]
MALRGRTPTTATTLALLLVVLALALLVSPSHSREIQPHSAAHPEKGTGFWASRKEVLRPDRAADLAPPSPRPNSSVPGGPSG